MPDLLLTHGYFLEEDEKEREIMKPYPTLGLLHLSSYLRQKSFDAEIFDTTFSRREELLARFERDRGIVGFYTNLMTRRPVLDLAAAAKAHGWTVVLGGPESANYPDEYLARGADVIVVGEGEETMAELLPTLELRGPHRLQGIAGTVFRDETGAVVHNPERAQIADLDALPWPDRERIDQQRYVDVWRTHHGMGSVNLITARGCPYKCRWCSHAVFGFSHRRRSVLNVADELEHIRDRWQPDQVWYADDVFTINHRWLFDYAAELKRRDLHLPFETISRADRMMREEVLETLARMGCYRIWIGSESGSQRILDAMERGVTAEQVQWATKAAQRHGIQVGMFLMWGYEGETLEDMEETVEHVKKANPDVFFTTVAYPIKNTGYWDDAAGRVVAPRPWDEGTDRDYLIQGRHSRAYYKQADRWLRGEVAAFRLNGEDPEAAAAKRAEALAAREAMTALAGLRRPETPFNGLAADYDTHFTATPLGTHLRQAVQRRLDARFAPGDRVLELACGTGEDAVHLGHRGVRVLATDASPKMIEQARTKIAAAGLEGTVEARCLPIEDLSSLSGPFDGAFSNFGGFNCVADLGGAARSLAGVLRPGAPVLLCVMGPLVPWEWAGFPLRGRFRDAFRRLRRDGVVWRGITVRYPSIGTLRRAFAPAFRPLRVSAIGALLPPTEWESWTERHPRLLAALARWERRLEAVPPLPWLADHYLLELERR